MKKSLLIITIFCCFFISLFMNSCEKDTVTAPEVPSDTQLELTRSWMAYIPDNKYLSEITIPGSHDAGADKPTAASHCVDPWCFVICQDYHFKDQLVYGARWFDIRVCYNSSTDLRIYHGGNYLGKNFDDILRWSLDYLTDWPKQTIILMIKQEHSEVSSTTFGDAVYKKLEDHGLDNFFLEYKVPTMGKVRGKIVIVRRFHNGTGKHFGVYLNWSDNCVSYSNSWTAYSSTVKVHVQDHYKLFTVSDDEKIEDAKNCVRAAFNHTNNHDTYYINFVSGQRVPRESIFQTSNDINDGLYSWFGGVHPNCGVIMLNYVGGSDSGDAAPGFARRIIEQNF